MSLVYDTEELTVRRTVTTFSVRGRVGRVVPPTIDVAFLTESGDYLLTESGDLLLTA